MTDISRFMSGLRLRSDLRCGTCGDDCAEKLAACTLESGQVNQAYTQNDPCWTQYGTCLDACH
jgi:hypothetical protein